MIPTPVRPWKDRLGEMDHSNGTSNAMIRKSLLGEITDLRKQNRHLFKRLKMAEARVKVWQGHTRRYQKLLAEKT